nr:MAG TPA_asm: hypothetical protein [Caudoviricetes sp.]
MDKVVVPRTAYEPESGLSLFSGVFGAVKV